MPENTVYVGRGTKWGNPWRVEDGMTPKGAVWRYRDAVTGPLRALAPHLPAPEEVRAELAGKNLACWCPPDQPCHSEVLLAIANTEDWMTAGKEVLYWPGVRSEHYPPRNGTVLQDGVAIFGGTACVRIPKQDGGTDFIQLSHIEPAP